MIKCVKRKGCRVMYISIWWFWWLSRPRSIFFIFASR